MTSAPPGAHDSTDAFGVPGRVLHVTMNGVKRTLILAVAMAFGLCAVVIVVVRVLGRPETEFPAWLEAIATVAAFAAAAVAVRYASGAYQLEAGREERWQDQQDRAQASLVATWSGMRERQRANGKSAPFPDCGCWIRNASELPITNVVIDAKIHGGPAGQERIGLVPPDSAPQLVGWSDATFHGELYTAVRNGLVVDVDVYFSDAAGRRWHRSSTGVLEPHSSA